MGYSTSNGPAAIGRATASVSNPTSWTEYSGNPIISPAYSTRLDSIQLVAGTWYLYSSNQSSHAVDLWTSTDGFNWAINTSGVLTPSGQGCTDGVEVGQLAVLYSGSTWDGWSSYWGQTTPLTEPGIRHATSSDGIHWTKDTGCANVLSTGVPPASDSAFIEWHQVQKIGPYYVISYEGYNNNNWTANLAYSVNPAGPFVKSLENPVFSGTFNSGDWDQNHIATPAYYQIGTKWYLFYQGSAGGLGGGNYGASPWSVGMATLASDPTAAIP